MLERLINTGNNAIFYGLLAVVIGGLIWLVSVLLKVRQNYRDYGRIMDHELVPQFWYSFCFFVVALFVWQIAI